MKKAFENPVMDVVVITDVIADDQMGGGSGGDGGEDL